MSHSYKAVLITDIAMKFRIRGGKTVMVLPDGSRAIERKDAIVDSTMVKIIARGHRWHRLLADGAYDRRSCRGREDQSVLRQSRHALGISVAGDHGDDSGRQATCAPDHEGPAGTISSRLDHARWAFPNACVTKRVS